jgi:hypothetical protein
MDEGSLGESSFSDALVTLARQNQFLFCFPLEEGMLDLRSL